MLTEKHNTHRSELSYITCTVTDTTFVQLQLHHMWSTITASVHAVTDKAPSQVQIQPQCCYNPRTVTTPVQLQPLYSYSYSFCTVIVTASVQLHFQHLHSFNGYCVVTVTETYSYSPCNIHAVTEIYRYSLCNLEAITVTYAATALYSYSGDLTSQHPQ